MKDPFEIQPRWLNAKGAAKYSGMSERTIRRLIQNKTVRSSLRGRCRLIDRESLDAWIELGVAPPTEGK